MYAGLFNILAKAIGLCL